jgi:hypothetical protein
LVSVIAVDTASASVGSISGPTTEGQSNGPTTALSGVATFTMVLDSQPYHDVTIAISSSDVGEGTVSTASVVFTTGLWNIPQTVTATGVDDLRVDGDITYTILTGEFVSQDANFVTGAVADVTVINTDRKPLICFSQACTSDVV